MLFATTPSSLQISLLRSGKNENYEKIHIAKPNHLSVFLTPNFFFIG
jgi:hypothetical protein